uniref:E7 oncogenic protein n=1 Tax=Plecotus austriacus papillomavirus 1 TaxID=3140011 RepID=A0AAU6S4V8_9PAPI
MSTDVSAIPDLLHGLVPAEPTPHAAGEGQEEERTILSVRQVGSNCPICSRRVIRVILATPVGLRQLQELLLGELIQPLCSRCVRECLLNPRQHGRT